MLRKFDKQKRTRLVLPGRHLAIGICLVVQAFGAEDASRPYRLESVDLKQRIIWGAQHRDLAFGGQDQDAEDGRPHTRLREAHRWAALHGELRKNNPLQDLHTRAWNLRNACKRSCASARAIYFKGLKPEEEATFVNAKWQPGIEALKQQGRALLVELRRPEVDPYLRQQRRVAASRLEEGLALIPADCSAASIRSLLRAQIAFGQAAEALDAEPPARAMDCGSPRRKADTSPASNTLVFDEQTGLYLLFGGDHLDYLTNDTWVFDLRARRWLQRHPKAAPAPRANHRLEARGDGTVRLTGGYTYANNTDYLGGQYRDLPAGEWIYDITANTWTGPDLVEPNQRRYRSGPFHPEFFLEGDKPDAAAFAALLERLPVNRWVPTHPPRLPRMNRDWGTARMDPGRDLLLRWSGGHSAHGGTDVLHYHFAVNRWELPIPVEFPLGQLYSNTSYPDGYNFNRRPWMTGHTYQNYDYDPPSGTMIKAGRPRHHYVYDPDAGDWIGRGEKPKAMQYNSCFYTLTLTATPQGVVCWDRHGRVHRYQHEHNRWQELPLTGEKLPGAVVDNSTMVYDSKRHRLLMITKPYGKIPFSGVVHALDLATRQVETYQPENHAKGAAFAYIDRGCYHAGRDLLLLASFLDDAGDHTPTPAYDCAHNRWIELDIGYEAGRRGDRVRREFPHGRSAGVVYDAKRNLVWGTDTDGRVYVLRLE